MPKSMRKEDGSDSFLDQLLIRIFINNSDLDQMLKNDFFCQNMHIFPIHPWLQCLKHCFLSKIHRIIYVFLLLCKFTIHRKSNSLISYIAIPFSTHIVQNHLTRFNNFIIFDIMKCCAVLTAWTDGRKSNLMTSTFYCMLKVEDNMHLMLKKSRLNRFHSNNVCFSTQSANIFNQLYLLLCLDDSKIWYQNPKSLSINVFKMLQIFFIGLWNC